jgi:polygalacturonase
VKITALQHGTQGETIPSAGVFIESRFHSIYLSRKLLTIAASLALSAVALPASASNWWNPTPSVSIGSAVVNVQSFGASGNGAMDDTAAFQAAIDALPSSGGTVMVPNGTFMIDALKSINLRSHVRLSLAADAYIKAIPNDAQRYWIIRAFGLNNVEIMGGHIVGDRTDHQGSLGQWGYGILIQGSSDVYVHDITLTNAWGDGLLVRAINYDNGAVVPSNSVTLNRVTANNNRRDGLSICPANQVYVVNSSFTGSNGAGPQAGIDIEPQTQGNVSEVRIENTELSDNTGNGLEIHNNVNGVTVYKVVAVNNKGFGVFTDGTTNVGISDSNLSQNYLFGVDIAGLSDHVSIDNNTIDYNSDAWFYQHGESIFTEGWDPRDINIESSAANVAQWSNVISPQK